MKNIALKISAIAAAAVLSSACIKETFPEGSTVTADQVGSSATALASALSGIPYQMSLGYLIYGDQVHETDMAYPAFMISQTEFLGDMYPLGTNSGYDWYRSYNTAPASGTFGATSYPSYITWFTLYKFIKTANDVISVIDIEDPELTETAAGYAAIARAARAFNYYMLMVFFEPIDNKYTDVSDVLGLTVPIITETTSPEDLKNNPRVSHDEMVEFILDDLTTAEELFSKGYTPSSLNYPSLAVVYGIMAKTYLWDEDYDNAATYARKAIDTFGGTPVTESQWLDVSTGFNTANQAWMWYVTYSAESMGNLCNFTGWMSGEADWGYSSLTRPSIDRSLYDHIEDGDFRKYTFLDPDKYDYYDYQTCRDEAYINEAPAYLSLKFRCRGGDWENYAVGGAVDCPVMRVEEMYLIEAEATAAAGNLSGGIALLESFMQTYRQSNYVYSKNKTRYTAETDDTRLFQLEVLDQMRIEFWGEGNAFASAKRLKPGVMQNYEGTNAPENIFKINCEGIKPNWNMVIPQSEIDGNPVLESQNNPDPTQTISYPSPVGSYADPISSSSLSSSFGTSAESANLFFSKIN